MSANKTRPGRPTLVGNRFGKLLVTKWLGSRMASGYALQSLWEVRCDCGAIGEAYGHVLKLGHLTACQVCS